METSVEETHLTVIEPSALESMERANIDVAVSTAHKYPRSLAVVKRRMMELATLDEETAESCFYKLNRQGKNIEGPSIRLAEIAASSFGNLRYGARVIANDGKQITAQGFCHDLESNVLSTIEVKRRITGRDGRTYSEDMIVVTGNAACAIAARNAIFKVVPFAFVKPIFLAAKQTAVGDITTLADRRAKMLSKFAAFGVNEKRVCASVERAGVEEIGLAELETLIGVYGAIRDGEQTVDDAFPEAATKKPIKFGEALPPEVSQSDPSESEAGPSGPTAPAEKKRGRPLKADSEPKAEATTKPEPPAKATPLEGVRNLLKASNLEEKDLLTYLFASMVIEQGDTLDKMPPEKLQTIIDSWMSIVPEMQKEAAEE